MTDPFERFDQIDARFAKLFAAFVLLLVVGLITADIVLGAIAAFSKPDEVSPEIRTAPGVPCIDMPGGARICDILPPGEAPTR